MEETHFTEIPTEKIYSEKAIWLGALLGGLLVTGYFISENFKVFNEPEKAKKTWIIVIFTEIAVLLGLFSIQDNVNIPNQIFPIIFATVSYYIAKHFQEQGINQHIKNGGHQFSRWRAVGIGIIGCLITLALLIGLSFFL